MGYKEIRKAGRQAGYSGIPPLCSYIGRKREEWLKGYEEGKRKRELKGEGKK